MEKEESETTTTQPDPVLKITKNAHSALCRLRHPSTTRVLWIDAICINQEDIPERNAQVALMGEIYHRATRVVIDVGESSPTSDDAIDFISRRRSFDNPRELEQSMPLEMSWGLKMRDAVDEFYKRPWFSRVWVLQEAFMAREGTVLLCGNNEVSWSLFRPFKAWVDSRPAREAENWHVQFPSEGNVPQVLSILEGSDVQPGEERRRLFDDAEKLLGTLSRVRGCLATDARDKVFSLLSMVNFTQTGNDGRIEGFKADYNKSTAQVYTEMAAYLLGSTGLSVLSCANKGRSKIADLPSWVPDWSVPYNPKWLIGPNEAYLPLQASPEGIRPVIRVLNFTSENRKVLQVRGVMVDKILMASKDVNIRNADDEDCKNFVEQCRKFRAWLGTESKKRSPKAGPAVPLPKPQQWKPKTAEKRLHPPDWLAYEYGLPFPNTFDMSDNDLCNLASYFTAGKQLAMTEKGYFGLVPEQAKPGDLVCCFLGAKVPFVLREANEEENVLIGETYMYGLMEGEAFDGLDRLKLRSEGGTPEAPLKDFWIR